MSDKTSITKQKTFLQSVMEFFSGTLISRMTGFVRDVVTAAAFGTREHWALLAFVWRICSLMRRVIGENGLHSVFIPALKKYGKQDKDEKLFFFGTLKILMVTILQFIIVLYLLIFFFFMLDLYFYDSFYVDKTRTGELLTYVVIVLPSFFFILLMGLNSGVLFSKNKFFLPSVSQVFFNLLWSLVAYSISGFEDNYPHSAMMVMSFTLFLCFMGMWIITSYPLREWYFELFRNYKMKISSSVLPRRWLKKILVGFVGIGALQINVLVDSMLTLIYCEKSASAEVYYALRLQQIPLALFCIPIATVLTSRTAACMVNKSIVKLRQLYENTFDYVFNILLFLVLFLMLFRVEIVSIIYQRGDFDSESTLSVAKVLNMYLPVLLIQCLIIPIQSFLYAFKENVYIAKTAIFNAVLNTLMSFSFVHFLAQDVTLIPVATTFSGMIQLYLLQHRLFDLIGENYEKYLNKLIQIIYKMMFVVFFYQLFVFLGTFESEWIRFSIPMWLVSIFSSSQSLNDIWLRDTSFFVVMLFQFFTYFGLYVMIDRVTSSYLPRLVKGKFFD
jgi:putative peptidoglycan lipid II flippase